MACYNCSTWLCSFQWLLALRPSSVPCLAFSLQGLQSLCGCHLKFLWTFFQASWESVRGQPECWALSKAVWSVVHTDHFSWLWNSTLRAILECLNQGAWRHGSIILASRFTTESSIILMPSFFICSPSVLHSFWNLLGFSLFPSCSEMCLGVWVSRHPLYQVYQVAFSVTSSFSQ